MSSLRSILSAGFVLFAGAFVFQACGKQGEGERCESLNGSEDCENGLTCSAESVCCKPGEKCAPASETPGPETGADTDTTETATDTATAETATDTGAADTATDTGATDTATDTGATDSDSADVGAGG